MGTVHSLQAAAASPDRLRRRFDRALPAPDKAENGFRPFPGVLASDGIIFLPLSLAGQIADRTLRDTSLFWLSLTRQQLRFFGLIP
jgi:hypothetical protein